MQMNEVIAMLSLYGTLYVDHFLKSYISQAGSTREQITHGSTDPGFYPDDDLEIKLPP